MALDSTQIRLAPNGHIWVAAFGAALPVDVSVAMATVDPTYKELGYLDENGVVVTPALTSSGVKAWQSAVDVKTIVTDLSLMVKISMLQVNQDSTAQYFFGNSWVKSGTVGKLNISSAPSLAERTMVIEWTDDRANTNRFVMGRGFITDRDAMSLQRTSATALGVTFQCLDNNGTLAYLLSSDPDLIPAS